MQKNFLRLSAICAALTAITTFLLWFLPRQYVVPTAFEDQVNLANNPYYITRLWVNFIHLPLAVTGYFGLSMLIAIRKGSLAWFALVWFVLWALLEMMGIAGLIFAVNRTWRVAYPLADVVQQAVLKNNINYYNAIWDSMFFVLLVMFLLGTLSFGWLLWDTRGIGKILSVLFLLGGPLTLVIMFSEYFGMNWGGPVVAIVYPVLQPVSRFLLGAYVWKEAEKEMST